jgi:hypothetical protein
MNSKHGYQLVPLLGASVHGPTFFCGTSAHIGLFELPRASVSGHHGRTGAALDVGATLAGSSDENLGPTTGMCARPLKALGYVSLGKATPLHFHKSFTCRLTAVSQFGINCTFVRSDGIEILKSKVLKFLWTLFLAGISFLEKHLGIFFWPLLDSIPNNLDL